MRVLRRKVVGDFLATSISYQRMKPSLHPSGVEWSILEKLGRPLGTFTAA